MPYKDMREFLDVLEKDGQLKHIDVPIKVAHGDNELQALMRLLCQDDGPALMLTNLEGYNRPDVPLIFNPFGTRVRTAMTIDCNRSGAFRAICWATAPPIERPITWARSIPS